MRKITEKVEQFLELGGMKKRYCAVGHFRNLITSQHFLCSTTAI